MALLQLIATDEKNETLPMKYTNEYIEYNVDILDLNAYHRVQIGCDILNLEYFYFRDNNLNLDQFKEIIKNCSCTLVLGGNIICNYDFRILIELNKIQHVRDTFIIKIPNYLIRDIIRISAIHSAVELCFNMTHQFQNISLVVKNTFHEHVERRRLQQNGHDILIQHLYKCCEISSNQINKRNLLVGDYPTKGMFIIGDINNIQNLTLRMNGHVRFCYSNAMLQTITHIVSDNMFYISFEGSNNYADMSDDGFIGSCNLSKFDNMYIEFIFYEINESKYDIYWINANKLKYSRGFAELAYEYPKLIIPINLVVPDEPVKPINQSSSKYTRNWMLVENKQQKMKNGYCPISEEVIVDKYCICTHCKNNFSFEMIYEWLNNNNECPLCRKTWTKFYVYQVNADTNTNTNTVSSIKNIFKNIFT